VGAHAGLWELPVHPVVCPADEVADRHGVIGLRAELVRRGGAALERASRQGKVTGFDWNMWFQYRMSRAEFVATLKHTLDLRLAGNRCPFLFGGHSDFYTSAWDAELGI